MFIGNAPCSWGINYPTGNAYTWQEYLDQVAASGYRGTELGPFGFLPKDKAVLGPELEKRGLTLIINKSLVVMAAQEWDITAEVQKGLDAKLPKVSI